MKKLWIQRWMLWMALVGLTLLAGCQPSGAPAPSLPAAQEATATPAAFLPATRSAATQPAPSPTPGVPALRLLPTATATFTLAPTILPTYTILRGQVLVRANCRYGPGAPYLYKYGLVPGSNLEIIGRTERGDWILIQAIGGNNPCWVKASLMAIRGDVMSVAPTYIPLPQSPYYAPPTWVQASREGDQVTIYWPAVNYRAGDETASPPYLVEAWICRDGELVFTPVGSYATQIKLADEPGCSQASYGRLYFVEKHGYSRWIKIPWPLPDAGQE
jgi:hypothetical protein